MKVKIKKLREDAKIPSYSKVGDGGMDLTAMWHVNQPNFMGGQDLEEYGTGIAVEIPEGFVGLIYPRSSLSKYDLTLANHVGVIDSGYRGEIKLKFRSHGYKKYDVGDRIGQLMIIPYPQVEFEEVEELSYSDRGEGGFGSSGN